MTYDLVVRGESVLTPAGIQALEVGVLDGVVAALEPLGTGLHGAEVIELAAGETRSRASSIRTCMSTNRAAPSGRASRPRRARRPQAA